MPSITEFRLGIDGTTTTEYSDGTVKVGSIAGSVAGDGNLLAWAGNVDALVTGVVTRAASGAALAAAVTWPDGATGQYTATTVSAAFPGAVDAYTVTYVADGTTRTITQPAVTRNASGAVTNRPALTIA